jgi:hypothetical protein
MIQTHKLVRNGSSMTERLCNLDRRPFSDDYTLSDTNGIRFGDFDFARRKELLSEASGKIRMKTCWRNGVLQTPSFGESDSASPPSSLY